MARRSGLFHEYRGPDKAFERVYRADPSPDRAADESGRGLSLAREIARAHDGDLTLASVETGRITFALTPPVKGPWTIRRSPRARIVMRPILARFTILFLVAALSVHAGGFQFSVEHRDSTRRLVDATEDEVFIKVAYGDMTIPLDRVSTIEFNKSGEQATIVLHNGNRITGVLDEILLSVIEAGHKRTLHPKDVKQLRVVALGPVEGLIVYYDFDEIHGTTIPDRSGNGNDAEIVGKVTLRRSFRGSAARVLSFDAYIIAASGDLNLAGWPALSVSVWVKPLAGTTHGTVVARGDVSGEQAGGMDMRIGGDFQGSWLQGYFGVRPHSNTLKLARSITFAKGIIPHPPMRRWYHLVGVFDGFDARFYVNGDEDGSVRVSRNEVELWDGPASQLVIGNAATKTGLAKKDRYFNGLIDEFRIWKHALSEEDIREIYSAGKN